MENSTNKSRILKLATAFATFLFAFIAMNLNACPPNFVPKTTTVRIFGLGSEFCDYTVNYCAYCPAGPLDPEQNAVIQLSSYQKTDINCSNTAGLTEAYIVSKIKEKLTSFEFILAEGCRAPYAPPCDQGSSQPATYKTPKCWKKLGEVMTGCEETYCVEVYTWCWDLNGNPPYYKKTSESRGQEGPDCPEFIDPSICHDTGIECIP